MNDSVRTLAIEALKTRLDACENDCEKLAKEIVRQATLPQRRIQALIQRAEMQSMSLALASDIHRLQSDPNAAIGESSADSLRPEFSDLPR
jgi:hypothetical protein